MLSGAIAKERPDLDALAITQAREPVAGPVPGQPRRRDRRPLLVAIAKKVRRARR